MKRGFQLIAIFICLSFISCKKELTDQAMIIRDCTGTYLRMNKKDYKVCNLKKIVAFESGTTVSVSFKKLPECNEDGNPSTVCDLFHQYDSWIEVDEVR